MRLIGHRGTHFTHDLSQVAWIGARFDWAVALLSTWLVSGAYLDQWAHRHHPELESFFTPWHGVLYSGFLAVSVCLAWPLVRHRVREQKWQDTLSSAYRWSVGGVVIFLAAGFGDMLWHEAFGIEVGLEALVSPTHLVLSLGAGLIVSGPLRACWQRGDSVLTVAAALSASLTLAIIAYFTVYAHPFVGLWGTRETGSSLGMAAIMLQTLFLCGLVLMMLIRFRLVLGTMTLLLGVTAALLSFMENSFAMIFVGLGAGIAGDLMVRWLDPGYLRETQFRVFAFSFPAFLWLGYFVALFMTDGVVWTTHLWVGAIVQAAIFSWLLSYAMLAPNAKAEHASSTARTDEIENAGVTGHE